MKKRTRLKAIYFSSIEYMYTLPTEVSISGMSSFEIIQQDFGFDVQNGIDSVELGNAKGHYMLEVSRRRN